VRVSQFLFNVDKMKEDVHTAAVANRVKSNTADQNVLASMQASVSSDNSSKKNQDNSDEDENGKSRFGKNTSLSIAQHAISSLSNVKDSKRFGEIIDKMFVPTVQAYRQKEKERPFRRPTMNPRPSKGSSSPSQRLAARQRLEAKKQLLQQK